MRATLEFELPEEQVEFREAVDSGKTRSVLWNFTEWLRSQLKYQDLSQAEADALERAKAHLWALLEEYGVDL